MEKERQDDLPEIDLTWAAGTVEKLRGDLLFSYGTDELIEYAEAHFILALSHLEQAKNHLRLAGMHKRDGKKPMPS